MNKNYQQAEDFFKQHKIKAAMPLFEKVIDKEPDNIEARYKFGICLYRLKEFSNAEQVFSDVTAIDNSHHGAWYYLGLALESQKKKKKATKAYKMSLAISPDFEAAKKKIKGSNTTPRESISIGEGAQSQPDEGAGQIKYSIKRRRMGSFSRHAALIILSPLVATFAVELNSSFDEVAIFSFSAMICFAIIIDLFLRSITSKYIIYENRIDFIHGILFKKHQSIWIFEITNLSYHRNPWFLLTRNATINIESEKGNYALTGLSPAKKENRKGAVQFSKMLFDLLRNTVRTQRGEIKKVWI